MTNNPKECIYFKEKYPMYDFKTQDMVDVNLCNKLGHNLSEHPEMCDNCTNFDDTIPEEE